MRRTEAHKVYATAHSIQDDHVLLEAVLHITTAQLTTHMQLTAEFACTQLDAAQPNQR